MKNNDEITYPTTIVPEIEAPEPPSAETLNLVKQPDEKKDSRSRAWMLTIPADKDHKYSAELIKERLGKYAFIGQLERGKSGYLHYQVYLESPEPLRFSTLQKLMPGCHLTTRMRGSSAKACVDYVTKSDTRVPESEGGVTLSHGVIETTSQQGRRSDIESFQEMIMSGMRVTDVILEYPQSLRFFTMLQRFQALQDSIRYGSTRRLVSSQYIWGATSVGKTSAIYDKYNWSSRRLFQISDYTSAGHPWDGYNDAQEALVLDEFRSPWRLGFLLRLLDVYPLTLSARYGDKQAAFTSVYVLSNLPFSKQYVNEDKATLAAFRRRFESIGEMKADGTIVYERFESKDLDVPLIGLRSDLLEKA